MVSTELDAGAAPDGAAEAVGPPIQTLDPRSVLLGRLARWPVVVLPPLLGLPGLIIDRLGPRQLPLPAFAALLLAIVAVTALLVVVAHLGPLWRYRHTRYRVDAHGIEISRGKTWHRVITVPRSRVQHTDVSQGPLERRFGLATLIVYTAGTEHSAVPLAGLAHPTALALRDDLLHAGRADAV